MQNSRHVRPEAPRKNVNAFLRPDGSERVMERLRGSFCAKSSRRKWLIPTVRARSRSNSLEWCHSAGKCRTRSLGTPVFNFLERRIRTASLIAVIWAISNSYAFSVDRIVAFTLHWRLKRTMLLESIAN